MIVLLEYGRMAHNKDNVYGKLSIQSSLGADVLDSASLSDVPFVTMAKMFVDTVKQTPSGTKVYFRRCEQPDRIPVEMMQGDLDRLREDPDKYLHNMCYPEPVVLDLRKNKETE